VKTTTRGRLSEADSKSQLDFPNNRYVNDERICRALADVVAGPGITVNLNSIAPRRILSQAPEDRYRKPLHAGLGAGASTDGIFTLQPVLSSYNGKGDGDFNYGRYTNLGSMT
jgi:peptide/nickel transport system substrate-binding protein